jgi:hypothetical protein
MTARRYKVDGASEVLNHVALPIFVARIKTALTKKSLKAMPATFMEAYRQILALERITAEQKKQFVSAQELNAQTKKKRVSNNVSQNPKIPTWIKRLK